MAFAWLMDALFEEEADNTTGSPTSSSKEVGQIQEYFNSEGIKGKYNPNGEYLLPFTDEEKAHQFKDMGLTLLSLSFVHADKVVHPTAVMAIKGIKGIFIRYNHAPVVEWGTEADTVLKTILGIVSSKIASMLDGLYTVRWVPEKASLHIKPEEVEVL